MSGNAGSGWDESSACGEMQVWQSRSEPSAEIVRVERSNVWCATRSGHLLVVDALARASASAPFSPKAQHEMASGLDPSEHEQPCSSAFPTPKSKLNFHSSSPSLVAFEGLGNG